MKRNHKKLKLGHIYSVDWADHFSAKTDAGNPSTLRPAMLRTYGKLVAITAAIIQLETERRIDMGTTSYVHEVTGLIKSCITSIRDLGPDPSTKKRV